MSHANELEAAVLEARLEEAGAPWRSLRSSTGNPHADALLEEYDKYRWVREEFPNLAITKEVMDCLAPGDSLWVSASNLPWAESCLQIEGLRAAAELGRSGHLEAVLVACAILSHGFDFCSSGARPLVDDYRYMLPAVASYFSAQDGVVQDFAPFDIPLWFGEMYSMPESIRGDTLCRAVNPAIKQSALLELVWPMGRPPSPNEVQGSQLWLTYLGLGRDATFLSSEHISAAERDVAYATETLLDEEEGADPAESEREVMRILEPIELALAVATDFAELLDKPDPGLVTQRLERWAHGPGWRSADAWPDSLEEIRSALRESPWIGFV